MKTISNLFCVLIALLVLSFIAPACGKKTTPAAATNVTTTPTYTFNAFGITATGVQYGVSNPNTGPLKISGSNANGNTNYQTVEVTINSAVNAVGTYPLSSSSGNTGIYTSGGNTVRYSTNATNTGNLIITSINMVNKTISGSYNFTAKQYYPSTGNSGSISGSFSNLGF
jgi:hypothetical protein